MSISEVRGKTTPAWQIQNLGCMDIYACILRESDLSLDGRTEAKRAMEMEMGRLAIDDTGMGFQITVLEYCMSCHTVVNQSIKLS